MGKNEASAGGNGSSVGKNESPRGKPGSSKLKPGSSRGKPENLRLKPGWRRRAETGSMIEALRVAALLAGERDRRN